MSLTLDAIEVRVPDGDQTLTILDGASLSVAPGQVVALTGTSGSGKSTLLAVAGLLRRPDAGRVVIGGTDASSLGHPARTRLRGDAIGLVFQTPNLFPALTALEQVELVAHVNGRLDRPARGRARELIDAVGLGHRADRRPAHLSGGERQRVGLARALMNRPAVLLADEPTAALDDARGRDIMALLVSQAVTHDVATLVVTHNPTQLPGGVTRVRLAGGTVHAGPVGAGTGPG
jgi:putative ABC transport system ATP-binding protein